MILTEITWGKGVLAKMGQKWDLWRFSVSSNRGKKTSCKGPIFGGFKNRGIFDFVKKALFDDVGSFFRQKGPLKGALFGGQNRETPTLD